MAVVDVQKAMILQMVVDVGDQQVEENPAPQLLNVGSRVLCMGMHGIDQFGVAAVFFSRGLQQGGGRLVGNACVVCAPVKAANDGNGGFAQQDDAGRRCRNTGLFCQFQGQHLTPGNATGIADARATSGTASVPGVVSGQGMAPVQGASGSLSGAAGHPASVAALEVLTPEQAAQLLSVSVEDVLASIQSGELKARRIGTAYRIARSALDEFLRG